VARWRHAWLRRIARRPLTRYLGPGERDGGDPLQHTLDYNLAQVGGFGNRRSFRTIKLVSCVSEIRRDGDVLFIGPRNESDLIALYAFGFEWGRIRGFDLFSYSPRIDVGDMHELPYDDASFDVLFSSWALTYSHDPVRACREMARVARPGAVICVGLEHDRRTVEEVERVEGRRAVRNCSFADVDQVLACFGDAVGRVLWREQAPNPWVSETKDNLTVVFTTSGKRARSEATASARARRPALACT
jgi:SAM-dependent methyltransferase